MPSLVNKLRDAFFGRHVWITNTVTSGGLFAIGDAAQQQIEKYQHGDKDTAFDYNRNGRFLIVGFTQGLPHHWWYTWLDRVLPGNSLSTVFKKIIADQVIASPYFHSAFFFGVGTLEGRSLSQCWVELKSKFLLVYVVDCITWPPFQFINFLYLPSVYRTLYVSTITVFWTCFLSYAKHFDQLKEPGQKDKHSKASARSIEG